MLLKILLLAGGVTLASKKLLKKRSNLSKQVKKKARPLLLAQETKTTKKEDSALPASIAATALAASVPWFPIAVPVVIGSLLYLSVPIFKAARKEWFVQKTIGHDSLVSLLAVVSLLSAQYLALSIALLFYHFGKKLLAKTQNHSKTLLTELFEQKVEYAWVLREGVEVELALKDIVKGDHVVVENGGVIPVDGVVTDGELLIDQSHLTGESQPIEKMRGDEVFSSTQVVSGRATVKVTKTGENTTAANIKKVLEQSAEHKVELITQGEQMANSIAKPLIGLSLLTTPFLGLFGMTGVLNSTFGTRLQLSAPVSVLSHLDMATQHGVLIKDGRALETLSKVDTVLFDKTGTLTSDEPALGEIILFDEQYTTNQILGFAAAAESKVEHPIATAIIKGAEANEIAIPAVDGRDFTIGMGVSIQLAGNTVSVGSVKFMNSLCALDHDKTSAQLEEIHQRGNTFVLVAVNHKVKGAIEICPTVREEAYEMVEQLRTLGIKQLAIVSGDHEAPTKYLAQKLNMDMHFAQVMPEEKGQIVQSLQDKGHTVCFIGDGVNDAIAIQKADVSISIKGATDVACDLAHVILMEQNLLRLVDAFKFAFSLQQNMKDTMKVLYAPLLINFGGAIFLGFGLMSTVLINNASLLLALRKAKKVKRLT